MKFFLTGSTGFVGSNLRTALAPHPVHTYQRGQDLVEALDRAQPDWIINCAAEIYDADAMWSTNVELTRGCLEWQRSHPHTRMIQIGSSSEYGPCDRASRESDNIKPQDMYAGTKGVATLLCQTYANTYGLDTTVIRPYSLYGPGERPHRLFPRLWQAFMLGREMEMVQGVHDFCYIDDFVDAVISIMQSDQRLPGEIVNVSCGIQHTNAEVLECFQHVLGRSAPVTILHRWTTPTVWQADISLVKSKYCWSPNHTLDQGVEKFIEKARYE